VYAQRRDVVARAPNGPDASLGDLFKQLSTDTGELVRQEITLARVELSHTGAVVARDAARLGAAAALGVVGLFALVACVVIAIGAALDNYWLGALIVAVPLLIVAAVLGVGAVNDLKRQGLTPDQTATTLKEDQAWAKQEARDLRRQITH
jgi:uncharacterized membrane protein YqjE